jgi:hypothetical protein
MERQLNHIEGERAEPSLDDVERPLKKCEKRALTDIELPIQESNPSFSLGRRDILL